MHPNVGSSFFLQAASHSGDSKSGSVVSRDELPVLPIQALHEKAAICFSLSLVFVMGAVCPVG